MLAKVRSYHPRRTTMITGAGLLVLLGVLTAPSWRVGLWPALVCLAGIFSLFRWYWLHWMAAFGLVFCLGNLRTTEVLRQELPLRRQIGNKVSLEAYASEDGTYDSTKRLTFSAHAVRLLSPHKSPLNSYVRVAGFGLDSIKRGDHLLINGKLTASSGNVAGGMYYAEARILQKNGSSLDKTRRSFVAGLSTALPEPEGPLAAGLLIGQRSALTKDWQDILQKAGLSHIVAVSGYNLTILVRMVRRLLKKRSRFQILAISLAFVGLFVAITGNSPSIMRATIVTVMMLLGWYYGREFKPLVLVALSAAIAALIDPLQVLRSVGWYLSFAAFFGVLAVAPIFSGSDDQRFSILRGLVVESLAAEIMTLPIIALVFERMSVIGLLANILVVPLVPLAMLLALPVGLLGWLTPLTAAWLAGPVHLVLKFMLDVSAWVARLPGSQLQVVPGRQVILVYYLLTTSAALLLSARKRRLSVAQIDALVLK